MKGPTARQSECWDALQRHGGKATYGAAAKAARELGMTAGAFASAVIGYERNVGLAELPEPSRVTARQRLDAIPNRLDEIEERLASLLASQAAMSVQLADLAAEIRAWTTRQPIYVEMRPRHQRAADGGEGGNREGKRLRAIDHGEVPA